MSKRSDRKKAQATEPVTFFSEDIVEAPHADAEMLGKVLKKRKMWQTVVYASMVSMIVFALISLGTYSAISDLTAKEFPDQVSIDTPGKRTAIRAVEDWLAGSPSPLPTGYILSWDGATLQQAEKTFMDEQNKEQYQYGIELHRFTLATTVGTMFKTEVQVAFGDAMGTGMIGAPTLIPIAPSDAAGFNNMNGWINTMPGSSSESISDAVKSWVAAFTSGDPAQLRITVGDGREGISYVPMTGIEEVGSITVKQTVHFPVDSTLPAREWVADETTAVTRVSFSVAWPGQINDARSNISSLGVLTYDLLIEKANTSAPKVVAWGSAGTGPSLKPYQNSVTGKVTADNLKNGGKAIQEAPRLPDDVPGKVEKPVAVEPDSGTGTVDGETDEEPIDPVTGLPGGRTGPDSEETTVG